MRSTVLRLHSFPDGLENCSPGTRLCAALQWLTLATYPPVLGKISRDFRLLSWKSPGLQVTQVGRSAIYTPRCNLKDPRNINNTRDTHCANDLAPRTSAFTLVFPKYTFYVPNLCILGTRPILPCKNGSCCKLELVGTKNVFVLCYSRYLSVVSCSRVELSYQ